MTRTALVLGGGGVTGVAWELGILKGLADAGVDLTSRRPRRRYLGRVDRRRPDHHRPHDRGALRVPARPGRPEIGAKLSRLTMLRMLPPLLLPGQWQHQARAHRRDVDRAVTQPAANERIEVIRSRIGVETWGDRELKVTAVEAESREVRGVRQGQRRRHRARRRGELRRTPRLAGSDDRRHPLHRRRIRSSANADLAKGAVIVIVIAPLPQAFSKATSIREKSAQLVRTGAERTAVVTPDERRSSTHRQERARPGQARRCRTGRPAPGCVGAREGPSDLAVSAR